MHRFAIYASALLFAFCVACGSSEESGTTASSGSGGAGANASSTSGPGSGGGATGGGTNSCGSDLNTAEPSRYPLELVSPREAGTAPSTDPGTPNMPSGHRIFRAHPGIEYNVRAVVIGGSYPYRFSLENAPAGMVIDPCTGEISWPNPRGGGSPTITVIDSENNQVSSSWSIEVTTSGFRFVDDSGSDNNSGTLESPWQTLAKVKESGAPGEIIYFRSGTYTTTGMATSGSPGTWLRIEFNGQYQPVQWLAYPGETPVIDNGYASSTETGVFIRFSGSDSHPVYLDGLEIINSWDKGMQFGSGTDYAVFRRLNIHAINEAIDGSNSAGIMTLSSYGDPSWYVAYQDNDFHDNAPGGIKQYSHMKLLWEDCQFRDSGGGPDLKASVPRFEVRNCAFLQNTGNMCGLFGNMHGEGAEIASGEIRYNLMVCPDSPIIAMDVNQDGMAGEIHLYRNTFIGGVRVRNTDSADGPFHFERNVIINSSEGTDHIDLEAVSDPSRITYSENLTGTFADAIVDADGNLQGSYTSYLGTRGHAIP